MSSVSKTVWAVPVAALAVLALAGCGKPAAGEAAVAENSLAIYGQDHEQRVSYEGDKALYDHFCRGAFGAECTEANLDLLAEAGLPARTMLLDLAYEMTMARAQADTQAAGGGDVSDETYVTSAYRVVLGREPDEGGHASHLQYVRDTGDRVSIVRAMLVSEEFRGLRAVPEAASTPAEAAPVEAAPVEAAPAEAAPVESAPAPAAPAAPTEG